MPGTEPLHSIGDGLMFTVQDTAGTALSTGEATGAGTGDGMTLGSLDGVPGMTLGTTAGTGIHRGITAIMTTGTGDTEIHGVITTEAADTIRATDLATERFAREFTEESLEDTTPEETASTLQDPADLTQALHLRAT